MARVFRCIGCDAEVPTPGAMCTGCAAPRVGGWNYDARADGGHRCTLCNADLPLGATGLLCAGCIIREHVPRRLQPPAPAPKPAPRFPSPAVGVHVAGEVRADGMQFCTRCGDVLAARESRAGVVPMSTYHPGDLVERHRGGQGWKLRGEPTCEPRVF